MSLFEHGSFLLHSGATSDWRINCDDLTDTDIGVLAKLAATTVGDFHYVVCPESHTGSAAPKLRDALRKYANPRPDGQPVMLIVDDVCTTGNSMNEVLTHHGRYYRATKGLVLFARGKCPDWITPLFQMPIEEPS